MNRRDRSSGDNMNSYHSFLESLKGKMVTIYRGGPESKTGILLDVRSDFVTLCTQNNNTNNNNNDNKNQQNNDQNNNQNTVVYYQAQHVKSISEDSKTNSMQVLQTIDDEPEYLQADKFVELIKSLADETVQINQGGPESKYGTLLGVGDDHIILYTEDDGIVYFNVQHIKSICKYQQNNQNNEDENQTQQTQVTFPDYVKASDFQAVFRSMAHKWVAINRGGPESMEGVLVENSGGHYTLVSNEEVLRIHPYHIRSISCGPKGSMKQNNNDNNNEQEEQTNEQEVQMNEQYDEENEKSENKSSSRRSDYYKSERKSSRREHNEHVVKTIDYVWKRRY
jgi:spore coat protein B